VGVTSTSANRTSPANNPDNQPTILCVSLWPRRNWEEESSDPRKSSAVSRPCPFAFPHDTPLRGDDGARSLPPRTLIPPGSRLRFCCCRHSHHNQKNKKRPATEAPPPTSPHELDQVAVLDVVAKVADIHAVLPLAMFGEFDRFFMWCINRPTKRAWECF
jgi:hypothetical protein